MVDLSAFRPNEGRQYPLSDVVRLTYEDFSDANDSTNRLQFSHVPTGGMVVAGFVNVVTAYAGDTGTTATLDIGDADDPDRYTATPINLAATGVTALTITGDVGATPDDLFAEFAGTLADLTAGEVVIYLEVVQEGRQNEAVVA